MKKGKTVKDAARKLPIGTRIAFLNTWRSTGLMDLYDGELKTYFEVITQTVEAKQRTIDSLKNKIEEVNQLIKKS